MTVQELRELIGQKTEDPERGFHCQAYEDDRACCRTDIHIYR